MIKLMCSGQSEVTMTLAKFGVNIKSLKSRFGIMPQLRCYGIRKKFRLSTRNP